MLSPIRNSRRTGEPIFNQLSDLTMWPSLPDLQGIQALQNGFTSFSVDVVDEDDELEVYADLPGYSNEDISVEVRDGHLLIHAEQETSEETEEQGRYMLNERQRAVSRQIPLPKSVDLESSEAKYNNGVLTVSFSKSYTDEEDGYSINIE